MEREELVKTIKKAYHEILFQDNIIDFVTGLVDGFNKKFATYLGIGNNYGIGKRILIVGLDIGSDETEDKIQSLEERSESIQSVHSNMNPHMAGTYFTALYLNEEIKEYKEFFDRVKYSTIFQTIIKRNLDKLPKENPLSSIAFTNFYKFVTPKRTSKLGGLDRNIFIKDVELNLFLKEVEILNPDIIFFQSTDFNSLLKDQKLINILKDKKVFVGYHPSKLLPKLKYPGHYFTEYVKEYNFI